MARMFGIVILVFAFTFCDCSSEYDSDSSSDNDGSATVFCPRHRRYGSEAQLLGELHKWAGDYDRAIRYQDHKKMANLFTEDIVWYQTLSPKVYGHQGLHHFFMGFADPINGVKVNFERATGPLCNAYGETLATAWGTFIFTFESGKESRFPRIFAQFKMVGGRWQNDITMRNSV